MKRALLIAGGTVGGLGAVLAITPPQFTSTQDVSGLTGSLGAAAGTTQTTAPVATQSATQVAPTPAATKAVRTKKPTTAASAATTQSATPSATPTKSAAADSSGGYSGTVTGASFNARNYGTLSATVTFSNGSITNVSASQSPRSWSQNSLSAIIPFVNSGKITVEQVKQYSAASLPCGTSNSCKSQASFTADAFWSSVKTAITKAGL